MKQTPERCYERKAKNRSKQKNSDSKSEEGAIEDEESDFENHDTSERDGCYRLITTSPENEITTRTGN